MASLASEVIVIHAMVQELTPRMKNLRFQFQHNERLINWTQKTQLSNNYSSSFVLKMEFVLDPNLNQNSIDFLILG